MSARSQLIEVSRKVLIRVGADDRGSCGEDCPFLDGAGGCALFRAQLNGAGPARADACLEALVVAERGPES